MREDGAHADGPNDKAWPFDPTWVELAEPPLERLRREALDPSSREPSRSPTPVQPTVAP